MRSPAATNSIASLARRGRAGLGSLLLALLFLTAQNAALLHEIGHHAALGAAAGAGDDTPLPKHDPAGKACELCLSFAQVATPLHAAPVAPALRGDLAFAVATPSTFAAPEPTRLAARNRGPPTFL